jgi:hypothetical protein
VSVASLLVAVSAILVTAALMSATWLGGAAVMSVVLGAIATRIVYSEVVKTGLRAAVDRTELARSMQQALATTQAEQRVFVDAMAARVRARDLTIGALVDRLRALRLQAEGNERRAEDARRRAEQERARAEDAQARLAAVLDEVFGTTEYDVDADRSGMSALQALDDLARPLPRAS